MKRFALCAALMLPIIFATPAQAASVPSLHLFSVNQNGAADLLPGEKVLVVAELRSDDRQAASLSVATPAGLVLESYNASAGSLALPDMSPPTTPAPFIAWTGEVSATQPINVRLTYRVLRDAQPGDRLLVASGAALAASTVIRVCCVEALPPLRPIWRVYLPEFL